MSYTYEAVTGSNLVSSIRSKFVPAGWTSVDSMTFTRTYTKNGVSATMKVFIPDTALTSSTGAFKLQLNDQQVYIWLGTSNTSSYYCYELSISEDFFYLGITGPSGTGAEFVSNSSTGFACITSIEPYFTEDTSENNRLVVLASGYGTTFSKMFFKYCLVGVASDGTAWQQAMLSTVRPAIQDIAALGDSPPQKAFGGGEAVWPFIVVESIGGVRGRLRNIWFAGESYALGADSAIGRPEVSGTEKMISGVRHIMTQPFYMPSGGLGVTQTYSPLGVPSTNNSNTMTNGCPALGTVRDSIINPTTVNEMALPTRGPNVLIKKGSGV